MERHFNDLLRGLTPGVVQECGMSCIIPLLGDSEPLETIGDVENLKIGTETYGTVTVENLNDSPTIIPSGMSVLTKQYAQDHGIPFVKVIGSKKLRSYNKCCCVQDSQGGRISGEKHSISMLPHPLRETGYNVRHKDHYGKLWDGIKRLSSDLGGNKDGRNGWLISFMDQHKENLDDFVSHFEPVDNQLGAIILINGKVAGVEVVPSYKMWKSLWKPLIKDCYGSLALWMHAKGIKPTSRTRVKMDGSNISNVSDIRKEYDRVINAERNIVAKIVRETIDEPLSKIEKETDYGFTINTYENKVFCGQSIEHNGSVIYGSFVSKKSHLLSTGNNTPFTI